MRLFLPLWLSRSACVWSKQTWFNINIYVLVESEAREGKEPDNEGQRAFRGTLEIRFFPAPRGARRRGAPSSPFRSAPRTAPAPVRPRCPGRVSCTVGGRGQQPHTARAGVRSPRSLPAVQEDAEGEPQRARPRSPPHGPSGWRCLSSPDAPQSPAQSPPGRGCGCSGPVLTAIYSARPRRRQGESSKPWGSAGLSLAHLQRGCTACLETLANFHLQRTRLKMQPEPEPLQLSGFIQNSPHQLKSLNHPCQVHTPRRGHSDMCHSHRESSKSSPPAMLLNQSAIFSSHMTVLSLRLLLECILGTGYRESLCSWGPRRLGFCFESRCLLRM